MQIAIDGPAGAGKTSVARALAKHFNCLLVNTGAMYRAAALGLSRGLKLSEMKIEVRSDERILLNGEDVTAQLYNPDVDELASQAAARQDVREFLIAEQQRLAHGRNVVMEGRDIGTVVLPNADVKIYLDASLEERARRRCRERQHQEPYEIVLAKMRERDARDGQGFGRLQVSLETIGISTDGRRLEEVIEEAREAVRRALQGRESSDKLNW